MSKITVTNENVDKFVKRFHKIAGKELGKTLSESQELFAQSLGTKNYHELKKILENEERKDKASNRIKVENTLISDALINAITKKENEEEFDLNDINCIVNRLYNRLIAILHANDSKIKLAFYSNGKIYFYSTYGDLYTYSFFNAALNPLKEESNFYSYGQKIQYESQESGISGPDSKYLNFVFDCLGYPNISQKFFFRELDEKLYEILRALNTVDKDEYVLKEGSVGNIKVIDDEIYFEDTYYVKMLHKEFYEKEQRQTKKIINGECYVGYSPEIMNLITEYDPASSVKVTGYKKRKNLTVYIKAT